MEKYPRPRVSPIDMARPSLGLQPKHYKALELIEEGQLSLKEIAASISMPHESLMRLYEGNIEKMGENAALFQAELGKITARSAKKIRELVKDNKKLALYKMNEYLRNISKHKPTPMMMQKINSILKSLAQATPNVEIGNFSVHHGLQGEDLVNEFKRLSAIARDALVGKGVSGPSERAAGRISDLIGEGDRLQKKQKDSVLPPVPETGELP